MDTEDKKPVYVGDAVEIARNSAYDPKKERRIPTSIEDIINKVLGEDEPIHRQMVVGGPKPAADAIELAELDREKMVQDAMHLTPYAVEDKIRIFLATILREGIDIEMLGQIARLGTGNESLETFTDILKASGYMSIPTMEDVHAIVACSRAMLNHVYGFQGRPLITGRKSPLQASLLKDTLKQLIVSDPHVVEAAVYAHEHPSQLEIQHNKMFLDNFPISEVVLWERDIFFGATRGSEQCLDAHVSAAVVDSVMPMFWQFAEPVTLSDKMLPSEDDYDFVGFAFCPVYDRFYDIEVRKNWFHVEEAKDGEPEIVLHKEREHEIKEAFDHAITRKRKGFLCATVYVPSEPQTRKDIYPQFRVLPAVYEDDIVGGELKSIIVAALTFLTLKYVKKSDAVLSKKELKKDRATFKKVRKGKTVLDPVKIVNLRRPEVRERTEREALEQAKKNYSCWWMVEPHWRNQYYPSTDRHHMIRILGYPKGDFTKPFKPPRRKVYKAVR